MELDWNCQLISHSSVQIVYQFLILALLDFLKVQLLEIDTGKRSARISIDYSPVSIPPIIYYKWPWEYTSPAIPLTPLGPWKDIVIVNDRLIRTPQWPLRPILKSLADISSSYEFSNEDIRRRIHQEALKTIIKVANRELEELEDLHNHDEGVASPHDSDEQQFTR